MVNESKNINRYELYEKLLIFRHLVDENIPLFQILFEAKKANAFPNLSIALRIMLTIILLPSHLLERKKHFLNSNSLKLIYAVLFPNSGLLD